MFQSVDLGLLLWCTSLMYIVKMDQCALGRLEFRDMRQFKYPECHIYYRNIGSTIMRRHHLVYRIPPPPHVLTLGRFIVVELSSLFAKTKEYKV
jgi:hypothetical protein